MPNVAFFKRLLHSQKVREDTDLLTDIFASVRSLVIGNGWSRVRSTLLWDF
jgi:hypothetical protein